METAAVSSIRVKRAYRAVRMSDGQRVLVDAIWPRGMSRERIRLKCWMKSVAPSAELRRWFNHDPGRWADFRDSYFQELTAKPDEIAVLETMIAHGPVTLVYGARDEAHNNAVALRDYLEQRMGSA